MKKVFLLIVVPALLVALGFAQTPAASGNTDQINIKGCVGGSDGNYTVAEDNTGKISKITTSSVDLKAHLGQDVNLTGKKAGTAENSLAVTELNVISEHCTAAAAAPAASVSAPSETVITPVAAAAVAPAAAAPAATVSAPSETVSTPATAAAPVAAPDATASTPSATVSAPPATTAPAAAPDATASTPSATVSAPPATTAPAAAPDATASTPSATVSASPAIAAAPDATVSTHAKTANAVHRARPSARPKKSAETPAETPAAAAAPAEPAASTPVADAAVPTPPAGPPSETASTPAAPATKASTSRSAGMLVAIIVVVGLIGGGVPLFNRWKRRKLLEETRGQNLSLTKEAKSDPGKSDTTGGRKAA
jgi:hypothetical protein